MRPNNVDNPPDMETMKQSLLETSKLSKVSYREMEAAAFKDAFQDDKLNIKDNVSALTKKVKQDLKMRYKQLQS